MVNLGIMAIGLVFAGLAGLNIAQKRYYKKKFKDMQGKYDKVCEEHEKILGKVVGLNLRIETLQKSNADLVERIGEYKHLMTSGCRNLKVTQVMCTNGVLCINVVGQDTMNPDLCFAIKTYMVDPDNAEDREFAIREAEELIETIQKF